MVGQGGMEQKLLEALYCVYFLIKKKEEEAARHQLEGRMGEKVLEV